MAKERRKDEGKKKGVGKAKGGVQKTKKRRLNAAIKTKALRTLTDAEISVIRAGGVMVRRITDGDGNDTVIQVDTDPGDGYSRHDMDANDMIVTNDSDLDDPAQMSPQ